MPPSRRQAQAPDIPLRDQLKKTWGLLVQRQRAQIGFCLVETKNIPLVFGADLYQLLAILQELELVVSLTVNNLGLTYLLKSSPTPEDLDDGRVDAVLERQARRLSTASDPQAEALGAAHAELEQAVQDRQAATQRADGYRQALGAVNEHLTAAAQTVQEALGDPPAEPQPTPPRRSRRGS
jgi:hypothetical protein